MIYVYLLESEVDPTRHYVGVSADPDRRLTEHNDGRSIHTSKFRPWKIIVKIGFADANRATAFERYLKTGSGRAFAKRHF